MTDDTNKYFLDKCKKIHGDLYNYTNVKYEHCKKRVEIICIKHGSFEQTPIRHYKTGCPKCRKKTISKYTTSTFIERANIIHNNTYDYSQVNYIDNKTKINIKCDIHGIFDIRPDDHLQKVGCIKCSNRNFTVKEFIIRANEIHHNLYDYSKTIYTDTRSNIIIICKKHGEFTQLPSNHISGSGCKKCAYDIFHKKYSRTAIKFIELANEIHNNKFDYSNLVYKNKKTNVEIICKTHGSFFQLPSNHLAGNNCPKCSMNGFSQESIDWLEYVMDKYNINIQHALNTGEYKINKYRVDGFDKINNTVYEYYGSYHHGNPEIYKKDDFNKLIKKTHGEIYEKTIKREDYIKNLGYKVISIWDTEWKKIKKLL